MTGGSTFPDPEWLFEQDWEPPGYLPTPALRGLARAAAPFGDDVFWLVTYALALAHAVGLIAEVLRGPTGQDLRAGRDELGIAVGFHDGDVALLGVLGASGLDTERLGWA